MEHSPRLRVLVVDDEPLIRWSLVETLTDCGHSVFEAGDGGAALAALAAVSDTDAAIDVVLLDYRLPDSNDLTLLSQVRRAAPNAAVIMMTAHGAPEIVSGALELGAYQVVLKPFENQDLADLVERAHAARSS